jgi:hypothetical protein
MNKCKRDKDSSKDRMGVNDLPRKLYTVKKSFETEKKKIIYETLKIICLK